MRVLRLEEGRTSIGGRELVRPGAITWIDAAPTPEDIAFVGERFAFHPLALEDAAHQEQRPKFEQYGPGMLLTVVHRLQPTPDDADMLALELDAFLTQDGFFGMNLEIVHPNVAVPFVLVAVVTLPAAMWIFFKRKRLL